MHSDMTGLVPLDPASGRSFLLLSHSAHHIRVPFRFRYVKQPFPEQTAIATSTVKVKACKLLTMTAFACISAMVCLDGSLTTFYEGMQRLQTSCIYLLRSTASTKLIPLHIHHRTCSHKETTEATKYCQHTHMQGTYL